MSNSHELLQQLRNLLGDEDVDLDQIMMLSTKLAEADPNRVRFSIDASHIDRLGRELVAKQETAVAELVKNGYDADATHVDLIFSDADKAGGILEIYDDGNGMTREQLINGFMRLSTPDKLDFPKSPLYGRARAGRKGIGRFAAQRLGAKLIITTQIEESSLALEVVLDWNKYIPHTELSSVSHRIREVSKKRLKGTVLTIEGLHDSWSYAQIKRAHRYTAKLLQPFPLSKVESKDDIDPGFKAAFYQKEKDDLKVIADEESTILKHAIGVISGHIDQEGKGVWSFEGNKIDLNVKDQPIEYTNKYIPKILGGVSFQAHYFIHSDVPTSYKTVVRETLKQQGGIRLYRNGFRVLPYGEKYDDWLRLEHSYGVRQVLAPIRNSNFMGFVSVKDPDGHLFQETASREGLVENEFFFALREFLASSLKGGAIIAAHTRGKKALPSRRFDSPEEALNAFMGQATKLSQNILSERPVSKKRAKRMQAAAAEAQRLIAEVPMLRILAGLGLMIGEFTHEIKLTFGAVQNKLDLIRKYVGPDGQRSLDELGSFFDSIQSFARYFDHAIVDNAHRKILPIDLVDVVYDFKEIVEPRLTDLKIHMDVIQNDFDLFTKPMHKSEWTSILFNLYSNSIKSIRKVDHKGAIRIELSEMEKTVRLQFSDNGIGIPEENWDKVFDAFYTTSAQPGTTASYSEELTGSGLGLKVVKDIIRSARGSIEVEKPPTGFTASFVIEIPKAKPEEIPEDVY